MSVHHQKWQPPQSVHKFVIILYYNDNRLLKCITHHDLIKQRTDVVISASKRARWYPLASETKDFALHSFRQAVAEVTSAMRSVKAREEIQHLSFNLERLQVYEFYVLFTAFFSYIFIEQLTVFLRSSILSIYCYRILYLINNRSIITQYFSVDDSSIDVTDVSSYSNFCTFVLYLLDTMFQCGGATCQCRCTKDSKSFTNEYGKDFGNVLLVAFSMISYPRSHFLHKLLSESLLTEASNRLDELKKVYAKNREYVFRT